MHAIELNDFDSSEQETHFSNSTLNHALSINLF